MVGIWDVPDYFILVRMSNICYLEVQYLEDTYVILLRNVRASAKVASTYFYKIRICDLKM